MSRIAEFLADYIIQKGAIDESEREMYEYGFVIAMETGLFMLSCIVISFFIHTVPEGLLFFFLFIPLRSYAGGLHLKDYRSCFLLSCLTFFVIMITGKYISIPSNIALLIVYALEFAVYRLYPVENENRIVDEIENQQFEKRLKQFLALDGIIALIFAVLDWGEYLQTTMFTFFMVAITMVIGKVWNRGSSDGL